MDMGAGRPSPTETHCLLNIFLLPFEEYFYSPISKVSDPSRDAKTIGYFSCLSSEEDTLNSASHKDMRPSLQRDLHRNSHDDYYWKSTFLRELNWFLQV
jgi:hypothetical protein